MKNTMQNMQSTPKKRNKKKILSFVVVGVVVLIFAFIKMGVMFASSLLLSPAWQGSSKDFSVCKTETAKFWGKDCGNLTQTHQYTFSEVQFPTVNGYKLPGWLVKTADNNMGPAKGAIVLVPAGGGDRREMTRYISYYLSQHLDVLTIDMSCQGESPCSPAKGLTYGQRESGDVFSAYTYLSASYAKVYAMGTSVGAASILTALPEMPKMAGVIAENPYKSFQDLLKETKESKSTPKWFLNMMLSTTMSRGRFDGLASPKNALPLAKANVPILFIHSMKDTTVPYHQTSDLAKLYSGPSTVWLPNYGSHAEIWSANKADYEAHVTAFLGSN
ncbi:MAG TPA: prolyl oligopeptidase family serine peptidase [Candidatus Saccharimonadia bacterium]|nr:prolyl oligopeptidase family serine peptidase [Candidatus Saccharimonadia bacterium]